MRLPTQRRRCVSRLTALFPRMKGAGQHGGESLTNTTRSGIVGVVTQKLLVLRFRLSRLVVAFARHAQLT